MCKNKTLAYQPISQRDFVRKGEVDVACEMIEIYKHYRVWLADCVDIIYILKADIWEIDRMWSLMGCGHKRDL